MTDDLDEAALNALLAQGIDLPTAAAGSAADRPPELRPGIRPSVLLVWMSVLGLIGWAILRLALSRGS